VTVLGNSCSSPGVLTGSGTWTIVENNNANWAFVGATTTPPEALISVTPAKSQVKVTVAANQDVEVFVTNTPATGNVKVCKTSAAFSGSYSFTVNGTPVSAVANGACSNAVDEQPGSRINIVENVPPGEQVAGVTTTSNLKIRSQGLNTAGTQYIVRVTTGIGPNVITFDNEPIGPSQQGTFQICKSSGGDPIIDHMTAPFVFAVTDSTTVTQTVSTIVGQCTGPITVLAGNVHIVETIPANTFLAGVSVQGAGSLGPVNLTNGEATVVIPVASAGDTLVTFTDNATTATLKVCKFLTGNSGALAGTKFNFKVSDPGIPDGLPGSKANPVPVTVVATASSTGACTIVTSGGSALAFPVGSTATATEDLSSFNGFVTSNQPGDSASTPIVSGINSISITNQALGQLELCKNIVEGDYSNFVFTFTYKNTDPTVTDPRASGTFQVAAGHCTPPIIVPPGNYTITEVLSKTTTGGVAPAPANWFSFVASNAMGDFGDNRCVPQVTSGSPNCGNPITVSVPYFYAADPVLNGETVVFFLNRVQQATIKICKLIAPGSETPFKTTSFNFTWSSSFFSGGATVSPPYPGPTSCTGEIPVGPVITPNNSRNVVTVTETAVAGGKVDLITVNNSGANVLQNNTTAAPGKVIFNPGVGTNIVTYTNSFPGP
jgi:hypothetical protein